MSSRPRQGARKSPPKPSPKSARPHPTPPERLGGWEAAAALALPAALALLLSFRMFSLTYLYDDFDFLGRALAFRWSDLLPDAGTLYWRPLSREGYFRLLALDSAQPLWGHLGNALLLIVSVLLVASLTRKIAGATAGLLAGVLFASLAPIPTLIGWVSCSQDAFAIVLVLAALHFMIGNRLTLAVGATGLALLSKETSLAFVPALVLIRPLLDRKPYRWRTSLIAYGALVSAWAAVHPGIHVLIARRFESAGSTLGTLTLSGADRWGSMARGLATLANLPVVAPSTAWPSELTGLCVAAAFLAGGGVWLLYRKGRAAASPLRISILGALLTLPAILLISLLVKRWQPYYLVLAAIGSSIVGGYFAAKLPRFAVALLVVGFVILGVWYRGTDLGMDIPTERNMRPPSDRLKILEAGFRKLFPSMSDSTNVYLSTQTPDMRDVPFHLIRFQVLRAWYRNPTIETIHAERRRPRTSAEKLAWISADLRVHRIDLRTLEATSSEGSTDSVGYAATLRAYAQGLAASGESRRGEEILLGMKEGNEWYAAFDRRLAAALMLADGRKAEAEAILRDTPSFQRQDAIAAASELLANPPRRNLDAAVLVAMGLSPEDPETMREMMRGFATRKYPDATIRFAQRLLQAKPGDPEAEAVIRILQPRSTWEQVTDPVEHDVVW